MDMVVPPYDTMKSAQIYQTAAKLKEGTEMGLIVEG